MVGKLRFLFRSIWKYVCDTTRSKRGTHEIRKRPHILLFYFLSLQYKVYLQYPDVKIWIYRCKGGGRKLFPPLFPPNSISGKMRRKFPSSPDRRNSLGGGLEKKVKTNIILFKQACSCDRWCSLLEMSDNLNGKGYPPPLSALIIVFTLRCGVQFGFRLSQYLLR